MFLSPPYEEHHTNAFMFLQQDATALHLVADKGHAEIAKLLLADERFTEINAEDFVRLLFIHLE